MTNKKRLEEAKLMSEMLKVETRLPHNFPFDLVDWLVEQAELVQELESFKKSVEYTVDSETLELIIDNQDSDRVLSFSETYDEKIYLLQKRVQELEDAVESYKKTSKHANISHKMAEEQLKRYREALSIISANLPLDGREHYVDIARKALEGEE